ncbi:MAG TPA: tRNA uridine-5-carboxymethylaminomethyl(34) synthesis GTPase MnmE [Nitrospirales bacterium]|nr:tRNA uridine-5-carboxymethylaminomethyl(34) synthesis GTPase MnmE [Nitrospirales bacterium]
MGSLDDTICAVATPMGEGGVGIVRVSGTHALPVASSILRLRSGKPLEQIKPYQLYLGQFVWNPRQSGKIVGREIPSVLDEVLVVTMRAPRSYTGEDVVEVHAHGGPVIVNAICEALTQAGARLAEPGEFTKRSFLNGRMDLTQAEGVLDTIRANSLQSLRMAQEHLQGRLSLVIQHQRDRLVKLVAHLEAGMDFVDDDIQFIDQSELKHNTQEVLREILQLLESAEEGRMIREGIRTVIIGRPNVGKSSLLNGILGTNRAIVSHIPGTTRDVLEEAIMVEGVIIRLFDTAGLRETMDELENEGMNRATQAIEEADVLIMAFDRSSTLNEKDLLFIEKYHEKPCVMVLNKIDLPAKFSHEELQDIVSQHKKISENSSVGEKRYVEVSALSGEGLDNLKKAIKSLAVGRQYEAGDSVLVSRLRHKILLRNAGEALKNALLAIDDGLSAECVALELRMALNSLGEIVGAITNEDILDQIFREFCIGK